MVSYSEPWQSQNSLFEHFQQYLDIFRDTDAYSTTPTDAQLGGREEASLTLFENFSYPFVLILERKALIESHLWVKLSIQSVVLRVSRRKKLQNVSLQNLFFLCFWENVYRSALHPLPLCPEKILVAYFQLGIIPSAKHSI